MLDEKSICPRIETGYAYRKDMSDELVGNFNNGNFNQGSAILKLKCYSPENPVVQHLPVKEN